MKTEGFVYVGIMLATSSLLVHVSLESGRTVLCVMAGVALGVSLSALMFTIIATKWKK